MKIQELLYDKSKWIKKQLACDKNGYQRSVHHMDAECFCLIGSVYKCYKGEFVTDILNKIRKEIANELRIQNPYQIENISIADYNDSELTSFEDIRRLIKKLDI